MNIRNRLTLRFILSVAVIMIMSSLLIYIFSANYRVEDFYTRLRNKADNTAMLLIDVDEVNVDLLRKIEQNSPVSLPNEKIIVYDFRNAVIFSTDEKHVITVTKDLLDRIRLEDEVRFRQGDYEVLGFLFKGRYDRFAVVAAATDVNGQNKLSNLRTILLIVFAMSMVVISVSGWFFAGKALQPISKVVRQVDGITINRLDLRVDEGNGKDEIAQLARTFNSMLSRLEGAFIVQKNFIANASHELRTPLTAITGQLEVTLMSARSNAEYASVAASVLEDIRTLNNLANRLLLLAQTGTGEGEAKRDKVRIDELLWQTRDELLRRQPAYIINVDLDEAVADEAMLTLEGDEHLVRAALTNLIENGCKYSADHRTDVVISGDTESVAVRFTDRGIGIPVEEQHNIFEPFYRGANTQGIKGHGIGLSVVKRIMLLHGGAIRVESEPGKGTSFLLTFPKR